MFLQSASEQQTEAFGREMALRCDKNDFVALYGDMGSGKTVFMRGFVSALVPEARVSSPTYAILNVYENDQNKINHFDLYRITSEDDLYSIGFDEIVQEGITVCEWSENIPYALPDRYWKIVFSKPSETERILQIERIDKNDPWN